MRNYINSLRYTKLLVNSNTDLVSDKKAAVKSNEFN